jgi:ribosome-interacting GTPase 1
MALTGWGEAVTVEGMTPKRTVIAATKADLPGALDALPALEEAAGGLPVVPVAVAEEFGLDETGAAIFAALEVIRVFTKAPGEEPDREAPVVLPIGGTVLDFAEALHRGWEKRLRYALLWGASGRFAAQRVGKDHVLADGDTLELHG